jgi:hypothetical protein
MSAGRIAIILVCGAFLVYWLVLVHPSDLPTATRPGEGTSVAPLATLAGMLALATGAVWGRCAPPERLASDVIARYCEPATGSGTAEVVIGCAIAMAAGIACGRIGSHFVTERAPSTAQET